MNPFTISKNKTIPMETFNAEDQFVLMEINLGEVVASAPMTRAELINHLSTKYADQPLKHFNDSGRLRVAHLKSGLIYSVKLSLDLKM